MAKRIGSLHKNNPGANRPGAGYFKTESGLNQLLLSFFLPDFTVDPGISPDHARFAALVGFYHRSGIGPLALTLPRRIV
jgi:hypothetical protein